MNNIVKYHAGIDKPGAIKLSSNESILGISLLVQKALQATIAEVHRYPDRYQIALRQALAECWKVDVSQLILGNGSNELISLITRRFLEKDNFVISSLETFSIYKIATQIAGARIIQVPLKNGYYDLDLMLTKVGELEKNSAKFKMIFICNPNNPTGTCLSPKELQAFITRLPKDMYVILDEAYLDFAEAEYQVPIKEKLNWHPRLIILHTFSKVYAMSGLRLGIGISNSEIAASIEEYQMPFNINTMAQSAALAALKDKDFYTLTVNKVKIYRRELTQKYLNLGFTPFPSQANFLAIPVYPHNNPRDGSKNSVFHTDSISANLMFEFFETHNIMIRSLHTFGLPNMVRITIGTEEANEEVCRVLALWRDAHK